MTGSSFPNLLLIIWGAITAVLAVLFMWRYLTGFREENIVILDAAHASMAAEQREVVAKVEHLNSMIKTVSMVWGLAALGMVCVWVYDGYISFLGGA